MTAQLRAEFRKMRTTRTNFGLLLGLVVLVLLGVMGGSFGSESDLSSPENQREVIGNGAFAAAFAALIGLMAMTSEFRHGTIRATFLFTPARTQSGDREGAGQHRRRPRLRFCSARLSRSESASR